MINLRDAILRVAQYFQAADPSSVTSEVSHLKHFSFNKQNIILSALNYY
jgi:hypothetical protein